MPPRALRPKVSGLRPRFVHVPKPRPLPPQPPTPMPRLGPVPSSIHDDGDASDRSPHRGLAGAEDVLVSFFHPGAAIGGVCTTFATTSRGLLVTMSMSMRHATLFVLDPDSLDVLASLDLPTRERPPLRKIIRRGGLDAMFRDVTGGAYFFVDDEDRVVVAAADERIWIVRTHDGVRPVAQVVTKIPLAMRGSNDALVAVMPAFPNSPDEKRRYFYATKRGVVGLVELAQLRPSAGDSSLFEATVNEWTDVVDEFGHEGHPVIGNGFAVNRRGAFLVSCRALYRYESTIHGLARADRFEYQSGPERPKHVLGRFSIGSGTTPTLVGDRFVAIGDDRLPMNVLVFDQSDFARHASLPVFGVDGCCELSFIAYDSSIVAVNTFGYTNPFSWNGKKARGTAKVRVVDEPKLRLELDAEWAAHASKADTGSSTPKLSVRDGLVYTYAMERRDVSDLRWTLFGLDFRTGERTLEVEVYRDSQFEPDHDNGWGIVTILPNGDVIVGMWRGFLRFRGIRPE